MPDTLRNAAGERIAGQDRAPVEVALGRRMGDAKAVAAKYGCSVRHIIRMAEAHQIPPGYKLGALRRWDLSEIDAHIAAGCPRVDEGRAA